MDFHSEMIVDEDAAEAETPMSDGGEVATTSPAAPPADDAAIEAAEVAAATAPAAPPPPPAAPPAPPPAAPQPVALRSSFRARLEAEAARRAAAGTPRGSADNLHAAALERLAAQQIERERLENEARSLSEDPQEYLRQRGLTYTDLTRRVVEGQQPHFVRLEREVEELRAWRDRQQQELAAREAELSKQREVEEVRAALRVDPRFDLIREYDAWPYVLDVMSRHYEQTGQVMDEAAAAEQVERHLTQTVEQALKTSKFASRLAPAAKSKGEIPAAAPATTLTNQHAAEPPTRAPAAAESRDVVRARAAAKLKFHTAG